MTFRTALSIALLAACGFGAGCAPSEPEPIGEPEAAATPSPDADRATSIDEAQRLTPKIKFECDDGVCCYTDVEMHCCWWNGSEWTC